VEKPLDSYSTTTTTNQWMNHTRVISSSLRWSETDISKHACLNAIILQPIGRQSIASSLRIDAGYFPQYLIFNLSPPWLITTTITQRTYFCSATLYRYDAAVMINNLIWFVDVCQRQWDVLSESETARGNEGQRRATKKKTPLRRKYTLYLSLETDISTLLCINIYHIYWHIGILM